MDDQGAESDRLNVNKSSKSSHNDIRTIYKGKKYNWQAKLCIDTVEIIAFDTALFIEAPHVFVPFSVVADKIHIEVHDHVINDVCREFEKRGIIPPSFKEVDEMILRNTIAIYILDRITVATHPSFCIDVRDYEKSYRKAAGSRANEKQKAVNAEWSEGATYSHKGTMLKPNSMNPDSVVSTLLGSTDLDNSGNEMSSSTSVLQPKPEAADLTEY